MNASEKYQLLHAIGRANLREHEPFVQSFLQSENADLVAAAMRVLAMCWDRRDPELIDLLKEFCLGVEWDYFGDLQIFAASTSGEVLREASVPQLVDSLLVIQSRDKFAKELANNAMQRALGWSYAETNRKLDVSDQFKSVFWR